jgi:hypothetical protein
MIFPAKEAGFEAWKHPFKANSYHKTLNGFKNNKYTYGSYPLYVIWSAAIRFVIFILLVNFDRF